MLICNYREHIYNKVILIMHNSIVIIKHFFNTDQMDKHEKQGTQAKFYWQTEY